MTTIDKSETKLKKWLELGQYLPEPLRDYHDAKDTFKAMHEIVDMHGNAESKKISWIAGHCYVIDVFLWFMARRGYTLQRSRAKLPFRDIVADREAVKAQREAFLRNAFKGEE